MGNDPKNESAAHVNFFIPATQQKFQNIKEEFEFAISMTSLTQDPIVIIFLVNVKGGAILSLYIYIYICMYVCMYVVFQRKVESGGVSGGSTFMHVFPPSSLFFFFCKIVRMKPHH
jgi:hypothetical protein